MKKYIWFSPAELLCLIIFLAGVSLPFFKYVKAGKEKKRQEVFLEEMMQHNGHYRVRYDFAYVQMLYLLHEKLSEKQNLKNLHFSARRSFRFGGSKENHEWIGPYVIRQNIGELDSDDYILESHYDFLSCLKVHRKRKEDIGTASVLVADYVPYPE